MTRWKKKRQTMRHYDQSASVYDVQYREEQEAKVRTALTDVVLKNKNLVLDTGCGTGLLFPQIADKVTLVVGLDISRIILQKARKRKKEHANVSLVRADADYTPFQNNVFNVAFAITLLQNMPQPVYTLNEIQRVTEPEATIVVTGLRKAFSEEKFTQLLRVAGLEIKVLKLDEGIKEYVTTCEKSIKQTLKEPRPLCNSLEE
jgi:ubiquinone/menaquinone biosynthesis C-methylase UbiE